MINCLLAKSFQDNWLLASLTPMPTTNNTNIAMKMGEIKYFHGEKITEVAFTCFVQYLLWRKVAFISLSSHLPRSKQLSWETRKTPSKCFTWIQLQTVPAGGDTRTPGAALPWKSKHLACQTVTQAGSMLFSGSQHHLYCCWRAEHPSKNLSQHACPFHSLHRAKELLHCPQHSK